MSKYLNDHPDDGRKTVTEDCPTCGNEVTMVWDVEQNGYKATCPFCGGRLMLCDECQHPNGIYTDDCDYDPLTKAAATTAKPTIWKPKKRSSSCPSSARAAHSRPRG